jgi:hypothetical protein
MSQNLTPEQQAYYALQTQFDITPPLGEYDGPTGQHWILGQVLREEYGIVCNSREEIMNTANRILRDSYPY